VVTRTHLTWSQEKIEGVVEYCKWAPRVKATRRLTSLHGQVSDILHRAPKGATNEMIIGAVEDRYEDQRLVASYHAHLKTRAQINGELLQEFATATEQLTHRAFGRVQCSWGSRQGICRQHKRMKHKMEATSGRPENTQRRPQVGPRSGGRKVNSRVLLSGC
jgi:hypothetical protein